MGPQKNLVVFFLVGGFRDVSDEMGWDENPGWWNIIPFGQIFFLLTFPKVDGEKKNHSQVRWRFVKLEP